MNFFNDRQLGLRLKEGKVSSKEKFLYLLSFLFISCLLFSNCIIYHLAPTKISAWDVGTDTLILLITLMGTFWCYRTNQSIDDKDFIERFTCISFPICIQTILLGNVTGAILGVILFIKLPDMPEVTPHDLTSLIVKPLIEAYFYVKMNSTLKLFGRK